MKTVGKYNLYKGVSTGLTVGTPLITLLCHSELFIHETKTSISAAGVILILITLLFAKDKLAENFKLPPAFVVATVGFFAICMIESILLPMKNVCLVTMIGTGIDELTFKHFYKSLEYKLPESAKANKHFGFYFCKTDNL